MWTHSVDGAEGLRAIFKDVEPSLAAVRLHEVTLHQDGPTVVLRFDLAELPSAPPSKWQKAGLNTVQLKLALEGVRDVTMVGWGKNNVGPIEIRSAEPQGLEVAFTGEESRVRVTCDIARIDRVSAYYDASKAR